jgi:hypothetical protein
MIHSKSEIISGLDAAFNELAAYVETLSSADFTAAPEGRWSPGTQMAHLTRSAEPVNLALRLPRVVLRLVFGKARRDSHDFDQLTGQYLAALEQGGKASGRYVPKPVPVDQREATLAAFRREQRRLQAGLARWNETALDQFVLPHPLIGKITVRELLFFTIYHTRHHAGSIRTMTGG